MRLATAPFLPRLVVFFAVRLVAFLAVFLVATFSFNNSRADFFFSGVFCLTRKEGNAPFFGLLIGVLLLFFAGDFLGLLLGDFLLALDGVTAAETLVPTFSRRVVRFL